jgi:predicted transposase/invertase (TIGR01784 family)
MKKQKIKTKDKTTQKRKMFYPKVREKYIDPFTDFGFKKLFGEECNKDLLLDFLNELLHKKEGKIVNLTYLKSEQLGRSVEERKAIFDLYYKNKKGEKFIVEMQKTKQNFFKDRALYYSTFPIIEQAVPEDWNFELKNVYVVAILNFVFEEDKEDTEKYRYDVMLSDIETHKVFYKKLKFIYLEMPKFNKEVDELETRFEKWMYVIKNLKRLEEVPDKIRERIFEKIFAAAEVAKLTYEEYRIYFNNLNAGRDYKNCMDYAKTEARAKGLAEGLAEGRAEGLAEGRAKGRAEGRTEGRAEGLAEGKLEIARKLKTTGMLVESICKITGLTIEEIEKITI